MLHTFFVYLSRRWSYKNYGCGKIEFAARKKWSGYEFFAPFAVSKKHTWLVVKNTSHIF